MKNFTTVEQLTGIDGGQGEEVRVGGEKWERRAVRGVREEELELLLQSQAEPRGLSHYCAFGDFSSLALAYGFMGKKKRGRWNFG
jgi:hypothetical protein